MQLLRRALLDGALVVLPIGAVALLVLGIVHRLQAAAHPLAGTVVHPAIVAVAMLGLLCLLIGLLVRSAPGRRARMALEAMLLEQVPGYRLARAFAGDGPMAGAGGQAPRPALAAIEDGLCPALIMEVLGDGRLVVFVPGTPAPMAGALYVFTPDRVTPLDVPLLPFLKAIASWGLGLSALMRQAPPPASPSPALREGVSPPPAARA